MNEVTILSIVIGMIGTVCAIVFGYSTYNRNQKADNTIEGKSSGTILTEIGYIKSGVDDIKRKQDKQDERHLEIISRVTAVEQSAKQAHHRIDRIDRIEGYERNERNE